FRLSSEKTSLNTTSISPPLLMTLIAAVDAIEVRAAVAITLPIPAPTAVPAAVVPAAAIRAPDPAAALDIEPTSALAAPEVTADTAVATANAVAGPMPCWSYS